MVRFGDDPSDGSQSYFMTWASIGGFAQLTYGTQTGQALGVLKAGGFPGRQVKTRLDCVMSD